MPANNLDTRVLVYKVTCLISGRAYVGITSGQMEKRWSTHLKHAASKRFNSPLHASIRKHGREQFIVEIICKADSNEKARLIEREMIAQHNTMVPNGYNLTTGGEGSVGKRASELTKKRMADVGRAAWQNPEQRAKMMAAMENRIMPETHIDHLRRLAAAQAGVPQSPEHIAKRIAHFIGKPRSEETKRKISEAAKGRDLWSAERKAAHAENMKARWAAGDYAKRVITPEHRKAMSDGRIGKKRGAYKKKNKTGAVDL